MGPCPRKEKHEKYGFIYLRLRTDHLVIFAQPKQESGATFTTHVTNININHHCCHRSPLPLRPSTNTTPSTHVPYVRLHCQMPQTPKLQQM